MDKRKKYIMMLDVETANGLSKPLVYDIGFAVTDKKGNVVESYSFIIDEIFNNEKLMSTAYYAIKVPKYKEDIAKGTRTVVKFMEMREVFLNTMRKYNVQVISAYNLNFDMRALTCTVENLFGKGKFLTKEFANVEKLCIWSLACELLYTQKTYRKVAEAQGWISEAGNMKTSAEHGHRYITGEYDFEESHTGLEDVYIEIGIMAKCFRQNKSYKSGIISHPWRIPNKK